jgi:hypothetical protein
VNSASIVRIIQNVSAAIPILLSMNLSNRRRTIAKIISERSALSYSNWIASNILRAKRSEKRSGWIVASS